MSALEKSVTLTGGRQWPYMTHSSHRRDGSKPESNVILTRPRGDTAGTQGRLNLNKVIGYRDGDRVGAIECAQLQTRMSYMRLDCIFSDTQRDSNPSSTFTASDIAQNLTLASS